MPKAPIDPLDPITIEQSSSSASLRGTLAIICGVVLILVALIGIAEVFLSASPAVGLHGLYAGFLGLGAIAVGRSQLNFGKQENRIHFHADLDGIRGLLVETTEVVPWSHVSRIEGSFNDLAIHLVDGGKIHIREGLVGMTKGLKGLPSAKKITGRLESLREHAQESAASPTLT